MKRIAGGLAATVVLASGIGLAGLAAAAPARAAECSPALDRTVDGIRTVVFTNVGTCEITIPESSTVRVLVVGGGGAGASSDLNNVGGGGGGGVAYGTTTLGGTLSITVGAGGAKTSGCTDSTDGQPSSIVSGGVTIRGFGGGRGAGCGDSGNGFPGGSGGGAHPWDGPYSGGAATKGEVVGAAGITLLGSAGGNGTYANDNPDDGGDNGGGGGGGAGGLGGDATTPAGGAGGAGFTSTITGAVVVYGAGGGGSGTTGGAGGTNAGNGSGSVVPATAGVDGTGGGGGGGCTGTNDRRCSGADGGKRGGSGIVVLKYSVTGADVDLDLDVLDGGDAAAPGSAPVAPIFSLSTSSADRGTCWPVVSGRGGTWVQLTASGCTPPSGRAGATLLGWATSPGFPVERALAGVVVDEDFGGVRMIFIPIDGYAFLSGDNTLYPIWGSRT